ncbi:hypothetical protein [uncultured Tenacibaculum sp.]|uniref:hypothetical protein n=1 Tax=uncultured Tenacibaculum sp. TaxID=174713 RepID=UPI00261EA1B1|nr:hypothetical protein [uncultured Tenacibaculum sp.]
MKPDIKTIETNHSMNKDLPNIFIFTNSPEVDISVEKNTKDGYSLKIDHKK